MEYNYFLGSKYSGEEYEKLDLFLDSVPKRNISSETGLAELNVCIYEQNPVAFKSDGTIIFWKPFSEKKKNCMFQYGRMNYAFLSRDDLFNPAAYILLLLNGADFFICWDKGPLSYAVPDTLLKTVVLDTGLPLIYAFYSDEGESFFNVSCRKRDGKIESLAGFNMKGELKVEDNHEYTSEKRREYYLKTEMLKGVIDEKFGSRME